MPYLPKCYMDFCDQKEQSSRILVTQHRFQLQFSNCSAIDCTENGSIWRKLYGALYIRLLGQCMMSWSYTEPEFLICKYFSRKLGAKCRTTQMRMRSSGKCIFAHAQLQFKGVEENITNSNLIRLNTTKLRYWKWPLYRYIQIIKIQQTMAPEAY